MTPEILIRWAKNDDGPRIGELVRADGFNQDGWDIDWSDIEPWWMAAEIDGVLVAAVQLCPSKPIARVENLALDAGLSHATRGRVCLALESQWRGYFKMCGITGISGLISDDMDSWFNVAQRHGYVEVADGHLVMGRI